MALIPSSMITGTLAAIVIMSYPVGNPDMNRFCNWCKVSCLHDYCHACKDRLNKNALIGQDDYKGIEGYIIDRASDRIVHKFEELNWMDDMTWTPTGVKGYDVVFLREVFGQGKAIKATAIVETNFLNAKSVYKCVVEICRQEKGKRLYDVSTKVKR